MLKINIMVSILLLFLFCAKNISFNSSNNFINFGQNETLDILTWNLEKFPKQNNLTINYLSEIIDCLNVDIIALQEIESEYDFNNLVNLLDGWEGYRANSAYNNLDLAYLYKSHLIINNLYEIEELNDYNIPRIPLLLEVVFQGQNIFLINNHFKCCGNNLIEKQSNDEENRRQKACVLIKKYIDTHLHDKNVIILGDFNDSLSDVDSINVFQNFIDDSINYLFVDINIAFGTSINWSYPDWPSHIDHILITNELFDEFQNSESKVNTIHIENYFKDGWDYYNNYISDHRPLGVTLKFNP